MIYLFILCEIMNVNLIIAMTEGPQNIRKSSQLQRQAISLAQSQFSNLEISESQKNLKQCRICLQAQGINPENKLIDPCRCSGSAQFVHDGCLRTWFQSIVSKRRSENSQLLQKLHMKCAECQQPIPIQATNKVKCMDKRGIRKLIKENLWIFVTYVVTIFVALGAESYLVYALIDGRDDFKQSTKISRETVFKIGGAVFTFLVLFSSTKLLLNGFFVKKKVILGRFLSETGSNQDFNELNRSSFSSNLLHESKITTK